MLAAGQVHPESVSGAAQPQYQNEGKQKRWEWQKSWRQMKATGREGASPNNKDGLGVGEVLNLY